MLLVIAVCTILTIANPISAVLNISLLLQEKTFQFSLYPHNTSPIRMHKIGSPSVGDILTYRNSVVDCVLCENRLKNRTYIEQRISGMDEEDRKAPVYPKEWEVVVPNGTKLDALRKSLEKERDLLPEKDLDDKSPLPIWFRVYLRKHNPDLRKSGPYQYPRTAGRLLQWMIQHPNSFEETDTEGAKR
jgi:hypothetical protein